MEREAVERKRSAVLLANRDIYGQGQHHHAGGATGSAYVKYGYSESYGYGQQYHPHLAKTYHH